MPKIVIKNTTIPQMIMSAAPEKKGFPMNKEKLSLVAMR